VRDVKMPATPYRIWTLIQDAKAARARESDILRGYRGR